MLTFCDKNCTFFKFQKKWPETGAFGSFSGAQISCSGAFSSSSRACISSSGHRLQSLEAPEALSFSRRLAFFLAALPHINYACDSHKSPKSLKTYLDINFAHINAHSPLTLIMHALLMFQIHSWLFGKRNELANKRMEMSNSLGHS